MQRLLFLPIAIFGLLPIGCSHSPRYADYSRSSGFALDEKLAGDSLVVENLEVLGRVWGYAKYHHPVFGDTTLDADYELFGLLPRVAHTDKQSRNRVLADWIDALGPYETNPEKYDSLPANRLSRCNTDLSWTRDTLLLGEQLSARLVQMRYADRSRGNRYVTGMQNRWKSADNPKTNPDFSGETPYGHLRKPDCGYRLLAVFRFWNMVEYFFPSKYMTDKPWESVLPEYIARMIALPDGSYTYTMWRMIAETKDSHADMWGVDLLFGHYRLPIRTLFAEGKVIVAASDSTALASPDGGFRIGDEIVAVASRPAAYYKERAQTYIPCSNETRAGDYAADVMLRNTNSGPLSVRYRRNRVVRDTLAKVELAKYDTLHRYNPHIDLGDGIHYINPEEFSAKDTKPLLQPDAPIRGLIVDLRKYPESEDFSSYLSENLVSWELCGELGQHYTYPTPSLPGTFASSADPEPEWRRPHRAGYPVVVLVDGWTQSAGESYVQWLQICSDVTVVGCQSAGANGNVSAIVLPGGILTPFSGLGWFYSDGVPMQRQGVRIDIEVRPTAKGIAEGRDEIFDKGLEIIRAAV